ncbi:MAG: class I SAM-dependent methyltransferase [Rickettsiales bacterium]|nr:class I SAM-dependent methyltransferase [Rickettsiales bacterium]
MNAGHLELDNHGERLVPGYSHDADEIIRHRSTYQVFRKIIEQDIIQNPSMLNQKIRILDLGCGSGHGSWIMAQTPNSLVEGVDISQAAIDFAKEDYAQENIHYTCANAQEVIAHGKTYDYIVTRHALEHIAEAKVVLRSLTFTKRLMASVPYKEPEGNPFHLHNDIDESFFSELENPEFIYENMSGTNDVKVFESEFTNSFACIASKQGLQNVTQLLPYPQAPYALKGLEKAWVYFQNKSEQLQAENGSLKGQLQAMHEQYQALWNSRGMRMIRMVKKIIRRA